MTARSEPFELLIAEFGEIPDEDVARVHREAIDRHTRRLREFPNPPIQASVEVRNIGRGADWWVIAVTAASLYFAIPAIHKRIREDLEEWRKIHAKMQRFAGWVCGSKPAYYPDTYLFLTALAELVRRTGIKECEYLGALALPLESADLPPSMVYTFSVGQAIHQAAISRTGAVLWWNILPRPSI